MSDSIKDLGTVERIRSGDKSAFKEVFDLYYNSLCQFAFNILSDRQKVEEIVQNVFIEIWNDRDNFYIDSSLKIFLFISVNKKIIESEEV